MLAGPQESGENLFKVTECGESINFTTTRDTRCLSFLISLLLKNSCPVLLTGTHTIEGRRISELGRVWVITVWPFYSLTLKKMPWKASYVPTDSTWVHVFPRVRPCRTSEVVSIFSGLHGKPQWSQRANPVGWGPRRAAGSRTVGWFTYTGACNCTQRKRIN